MTGYQSKKAAARDKLAHMTFEQRCRVSEQCLPEAPYRAMLVALHDEMLEALAQPEQEPASVTYKEVQDSMNALEKGDLRQQVIAEELGQRKLYTAPPQRTWVEPTEGEWFEWWRVSQVANETEAEIDFADFLIIAQAVMTKLKDKNNAA